MAETAPSPKRDQTLVRFINGWPLKNNNNNNKNSTQQGHNIRGAWQSGKVYEHLPRLSGRKEGGKEGRKNGRKGHVGRKEEVPRPAAPSSFVTHTGSYPGSGPMSPAPPTYPPRSTSLLSPFSPSFPMAGKQSCGASHSHRGSLHRGRDRTTPTW